MLVFAPATALWAVLTPACFLASLRFSERYPNSKVSFLAFPICWTAIHSMVALTPLNTFTNLAYGLLDYRPIALLSSLFGIQGINFLVALSASSLDRLAVVHIHNTTQHEPSHPAGAYGYSPLHHDSSSSSNTSAYKRAAASHKLLTWVLVGLIVLLTLGGGLEFRGSYLQKGIQDTVAPQELSVSCILSDVMNSTLVDRAGQRLVKHTKDRLAEGDDIILWSEAAITVNSTPGEEQLIQHMKQLLTGKSTRTTYSSSSSSYSSNLIAAAGIPTSSVAEASPPQLQHVRDISKGSRHHRSNNGSYLGITYFVEDPVTPRNMFVLFTPSGEVSATCCVGEGNSAATPLSVLRNHCCDA